MIAGPLFAGTFYARAAEPEPFFRGASLLSAFKEVAIDFDPVSREGDGPIFQNDTQQNGAFFTS
jgi:hypothetical protein